jgi:hypothetical protein
MASTIYEVDIEWIPDDTYINSVVGPEYIAWRIGTDPVRNKGLWLIAPVVETPTQDLVADLLPAEYTEYTLEADAPNYGHIRRILPQKSIAVLEQEFLDQVATVTQAIIDGYR